MELDDRGAHAAEALRRRTTQGLDVAGARATVLAAREGRRQARRQRAATTVVALFGVLGLVAVVAVSAQRPGPGGSHTSGINTDGGEARDRTESAAAAKILGAMPSSPIDGKASWRLPVQVRPQSGLRDGQTVTVYGKGFGPRESLGIVQCVAEADTSAAGVTGCQLAGDGETGGYGGVTYATSSSEGTVVASFTVHRYVTTPATGKVDCLSAAERCLIGMGAVSNYDKSGGTYFGLAGQPAFPTPTVALAPAGPYAPGQQVRAQVAGLVPNRSVRLQECRDDHCQNLVDGKADADGNATLTAAVQPSIVDHLTDEVVACDGRCVLRANGIGIKGQSQAPVPDSLPLAFTTAQPSATTTTPPTTTTAPIDPDALGPATTTTKVVTVPGGMDGYGSTIPAPTTTRPASDTTATTAGG